MSLDYIPEPASSVPIKKPPAAGTSTLEVMADVHQRFGDVDSGSGEVEVLERTLFARGGGHITSGSSCVT